MSCSSLFRHRFGQPLADPIGLLVDLQRQGLDRRAGLQWHLAHQHFVGHHPQRIHVAAVVVAQALRTFGRHVFRRAHHLAPGRALAEQAGDAEVHHLDPVLPSVLLQQQDVVGFDIQVNDALFVGSAQRLGHLAHDRNHARRGEPPFLLEHGAQRGAVQVLHDEEDATVFDLAPVGDVADVRVADARGSPGLLTELAQHQRVLHQIAVQQLERDLAFDVDVFGQIDRAHAAFAQLLERAVAGARNRVPGHQLGLGLAAAANPGDVGQGQRRRLRGWFHRSRRRSGQLGQLGGPRRQISAEGFDHQATNPAFVGVGQGPHDRDKIGAEGLKVLRTITGLRRQRREHELVERLGNHLPGRRCQGRGARAKATRAQLGHVEGGVRARQGTAGQHLPKQSPNGINVAGRSTTDMVATAAAATLLQLLRRNQGHHARTARDQPFRRRRQTRAHVQQLHLAVAGHHDRRGRQSRQPGLHPGGLFFLRAQKRQGLASLEGSKRCHTRTQHPGPRQQGAKISALDVLADEEQLIAGLPDVVNLHQVSVHAAHQPVGLRAQRLDRAGVGHQRRTQEGDDTESVGPLMPVREEHLGARVARQGLEEQHVAEGARKSSGSGCSCRPL